MKKEIMLITMVCFMSLALATYYPGQTVTFENEFGTTRDIGYVIVGNTYPLPDLKMDINKDDITITFPVDMRPDTFSIVFIERDVREIEVEEIVFVDREVVTIKYENVTVEPVIINNDIPIELQAENVTAAETQPVVVEGDFKLKALIGLGILVIILIVVMIIIYFKRTGKNNDTVKDPFKGVDKDNPK